MANWYNRILAKKIDTDLDIYPGVVILGPRQVGKTTLAKELLSIERDKQLYLDLENTNDLLKLQDAQRYFKDNEDKVLIIDEVQRMPHLFPIIRSEIDRMRTPERFVLLGSSSDDLIKRSTESLAGRVAYHELHPLCIQEVDMDEISNLWIAGGYPLAMTYFSNSGIAQSREWVGNLVRSHIERELGGRSLGISPPEVELLLKLLASYNGRLINYSEFARLNNVSVSTIKRYIHLLERAYLIRILPPYYVNNKKRLTKSPKIYIRDVGILHYLNGVESLDDIEADYNKGFSWEAFVIQQIMAMSKSSLSKYFYRTNAGSEIDLILVKGNRPFISFEIKYSNSPRISKSSTLAFQDVKCDYNYIVTPSSDRFFYRDNVEIIGMQHLTEVLSEHDALLVNEPISDN